MLKRVRCFGTTVNPSLLIDGIAPYNSLDQGLFVPYRTMRSCRKRKDHQWSIGGIEGWDHVDKLAERLLMTSGLSISASQRYVNTSFLFPSSITFGVLKFGHFKFLLFFYFISVKLNGNMAFIRTITYVALQLVLFCIFKASEIKALYDKLSDFDKRPLQYEARVSGRTTARFAKSKRSGRAGVDAVRR